METNKITFEDLKDLLPTSTSLYYVDYDDNLNNHTELIQKCIDNKNCDALYEAIDEWYLESTFYSFDYYNKELITDICNKFEVDDDEAEEIFEEFRYEIEEHYYNVDDSNVLKDLVRNSRPINVRIPLYSNYDCINSHYFEGGYSYKESYFGDMVDVLNLNPAKVKKMLLENDVKCYGAFPNYKQRDGKELVSYADFWQELNNSSCGANLLVFVARLDIQTLISNNFELKKITIPRGNNCGLFSDTYGGGSVLEMKLQKDFTIKLDVPRKKKLTKYDSFSLLIDKTNGYSIDEVYGVSGDFFGSELIIK